MFYAHLDDSFYCFPLIFKKKNLIQKFIYSCCIETVSVLKKSSEEIIKKMSASYPNQNVQTRPFTVGVSIAAVLIFLIAIFHVWKFIFKKIKKWLNSSQPEIVVPEIQVSQNEERKVSLACIQQLEMILKYEDELGSVRIKRTPYLRSMSEGSGTRKLERKRSVKKSRHSIVHHKHRQSFSEQNDAATITFFAGYSHRHINDA